MTAPRSASRTTALTLGAIGVVYGDIGTSPLYALKQVLANGHVSPTPENVFGVLSLVFWTLTVIVSIKYVVLVLRADNNGEGGLIAMLARQRLRRRRHGHLVLPVARHRHPGKPAQSLRSLPPEGAWPALGRPGGRPVFA